MKKVVLLGDSIRSAYEPAVREMLKDEFEVWGPDTNCAFAKWTLYSLRFWKDKLSEADVIHWNNGLHDVVVFFKEDGSFVKVDEYRDSIRKIARELLKTGAKVVFATTTPIGPGNEYQRSNQDIDAFNKAAVETLEPMGVVIDDLHSVIAADKENLLLPDDTHPNEMGVKLCAQSVVDSIYKALNRKNSD